MNNGRLTLESMSQAVWYNTWTFEKFKRFLRGDILEVGCGIGSFTKTLTQFGNVWAIDIEQEYVNETKKIKDAHIGLGNIEEGIYFFGAKRFDLIVCMNVLEHIKNDKKALQNMSKLLKRDGHLIVLVPIHTLLYGTIDKAIGHHRRYEEKRFAQEIANYHCKVLFTKRINFLGALGWWFSGKILGSTNVEPRKLKIYNAIAPLALSLEEAWEPPIGTSLLVVAQKVS